jgi:ComF family protein
MCLLPKLSTLSQTLSTFFKRAFSQDCALCDARCQSCLCAACMADLPRQQRLGCPSCNAPSADDQRCGRCLVHPPQFDRTISAFRYRYPLDRLVQAYKFRANLSLLPLFADALIEAIGKHHPAPLPDLIVPLPLAPKRLAERGFNQSALLGDKLASALAIKFESRGMLRVRETPPQSGLNREARLKNVRGAFDCAKSLAGKRVAIVDDVMTTGATLSEAARALKRAGAIEVSAWVIARAVFDGDESLSGADQIPFDDLET